MTDVDCLYTDNPRDNPDAKPVRLVTDINRIREQVSVNSLGSSLGTGGMSTKLIAAELATAAGVTTVIMKSSNVDRVMEIIESDESSKDEDVPLCTRFIRKENRLADRKWWIAHGLHAAGSVTIDEGAYRAIQRKESGGRLLPAGVVNVSGNFASHQAVRLFVRRRTRSSSSVERRSDDTPQLSGTSTPSARDSQGISSPANGLSAGQGNSSESVSSASLAIVVKSGQSSTNSPTLTLPQTPNIVPIMSLSSSVASLDPLSRSGPNSPLVPRRTLEQESLAQAVATATANANAARGRQSLDLERDHEEWQDLEIGKGLALYNSSEIDRIKGHKSADIEKLLGYSETAHVIDSITFTDLQTVT